MIDLRACRLNVGDVTIDWRDRLYSFLYGVRLNRVRLMDGKRKISEHDTYAEMMEKSVNYFQSIGKLNAQECKWVKKELEWYKLNFDKVVLAEENDMKRIRTNFVKRAGRTTDNAKDTYMEMMVKLYSAFTQSDSGKGMKISHYFFTEMKIKTCPYCNRQYTFTLSEDNVKAAPEYDHFYDKSDYPVLAVSFYNLVPSCHTCNHIKGANKTVKVNPYFKGFESKFRMFDKTDTWRRLNPIEMMNKDGLLRLAREDGTISNDEESNIKALGLESLYRMHKDYVDEIIEKAAAYNKSARQQLAESFQKRGYTPDQVYDFVWGKYLDETHLENRVLSKLTRDMLEQLEIT